MASEIQVFMFDADPSVNVTKICQTIYAEE